MRSEPTRRKAAFRAGEPRFGRSAVKALVRLLVCLTATLVAGLVTGSTAMAWITPVHGVEYGPVPSEIATIYPLTEGFALAKSPTVQAAAPTVVLVHGGGWRTQFAETEQPTVAQNLRAHGFVVFDVNYPQDGEGEPAFPKEPEAIASAVAFARDNTAAYGGNPANIVLVGGSAGGNLVDLVGEQGLPGVRAVVSLSGPTNLPPLMEMAAEQELRESFAVSLSIALGCPRAGLGWKRILPCGPSNVALAEQFSPVNHAPTVGCPNWLLIGAEIDLVPISQQREFLAVLQAAHCNATLDVVPEKGHSFGLWTRIAFAVYPFIAAN